MEVKTISICLNKKKNKKDNNKKENSKVYLEGNVEIKKDCLKYFYGCWIKSIKKSNGEYNSGGFLTNLSSDTIYLRTIQSQDLLEFNINEYKFYVKQNNEQYIAMQQIELEKERNKIDSFKIKQKIKILDDKQKKIKEKYNTFENEKLNFEKIKDKFFKLFENGKVKILI